MAQVTVLIPAHNAAPTLAQTLDSLTQQHFRDFAVLVVDDASADDTAAIARSYADRLQLDVLTLARNAGVAGALNAGLARIDTPYIARLDADDLAMPQRLAAQVAFLEAQPEIDVCGTALELFDDVPGHGTKLALKPAGDATIKTSLIQGNCMAHPSMLMRRSFFDDVGHYDPRFDYAEDYELWCRGALLGKRYENLAEPLTRYRVHAGQVSQQKRQLQIERDIQIRRRYLTGLLGGAAVGNLPEFLSPMIVFTSRDIGLSVTQQALPLLFKLGNLVPDPAMFHAIVASSIARHLA
ncbi:glycosyltransferase [Duganella sp. FT80W]|uniref:Glycosyltransferase n=1 Tax=Duganella guangzhouensis TaxID=2666084 RepID=A0A6I2L822_9BURK|nr:glycosyltransferase [Duganella guangzhouensis]MRW92826.1 glycosyltransferase [Duganella guangzhouensis]